MKIKKVTITNFRSIDEVEIEFEHGCQILVGINESGKSNVLRALALLDPGSSTSIEDLRVERRDEEPISKGSIRFEFSFQPEEIAQLYQKISAEFLPHSLDMPIVYNSEEKFSLNDFCSTRANGLHEINIPSGERRSNYWALPKGLKSEAEWRKSKPESDATISTRDGQPVVIKGVKYFHLSKYDVEGLSSDPITAEEINTLIGTHVRDHITKNLPSCVYWKYSDKYLLPSKLNIDEFIQNPDTCIPLKSMFQLAGYSHSQIAEAVSTARQQQPFRYLNLLTRISDAATAHLQTVWKDHKKVRIELRANGAELIPAIQDDHVPMDMANRSDGFKRLASFLLQVSARVKTKQLENTLILIDEPEIALHPRGARNLMQELIAIGETNHLIYSTHSIFMIDKDCIERHIIIEKKNEITSASRAEHSRIQDEDVIYSAIGYSIFEAVNKDNVIFEGWRDKEIFRICKESRIKADKSLKGQFDLIGTTFAEGVKDVKHVAKFLELASRGCLIISDSDPAGLNHQKEYQKTRGWGTWVTLNEVYGLGTKFSGEDLLKPETIIKRANIFRKDHPELREIAIEDLAHGVSTIKNLENWIAQSLYTVEERKSAINELKDKLFEKLKRDEISDEADALIDFVLKHKFR
jgi:energy-coupling factor transporter ATP-binding protein EcfA2